METPPLLQTKLHIPPPRFNLVPRPRLIERLDEGLRQSGGFGQSKGFACKLTLVSAPAGYGKTTLVADWLRRVEDGVTWLSLDESDNDPARFLAYLVAALQRIDPRIGEAVQAMRQSPQPPEIVLTALINEITTISSAFILVIDDYHLIQSPVIHQQLTFLLERQPPQMHQMIITREDPPLPISRLRVRGQVTEIRQDDLRFTVAETAHFLQQVIGLDLSPDDIAALEHRTEGWVAGLQLAALAMQRQDDVQRFVQSFAGSSRYILDYLIEEVFQQQPAEVQEFLLYTAILEQLTAPLCDAVLRQGGDESSVPSPPQRVAQSMLEYLERANLFIISLDDSGQWFRYHHLFADLLRHRLRQKEQDIAALHRKAGGWHAANGFPDRAIRHYLAAEAWEQAATLIYEQSDALLMRGENTTLLRWVQALPDAVIYTHPQLCLNCAWALALSGHPDEADTYLQVAEEGAQDDPAQYREVLTAQIHVARTRHDLARTIRLSRHALSLVLEDEHETRGVLNLNLGIAHWQSGEMAEAAQALTEARQAARQTENHHVGLLVTGFLGIIRTAQGQLRQAADLLRPVLDWGAAYPASALPQMALGALFYEWNVLEDAEAHLQQAITLAQRSGNTELQCNVYRLWAQLKQAQGDNAAALTALAQAVDAAGPAAPPLTHARNAAAYAQIALAQGDLETAQHWVEQMPTAASASLFYPLLHLAPAHLYLAQGNKIAAASHLAAQYERADREGWRYGQIETRLWQALAAPYAEGRRHPSGRCSGPGPAGRLYPHLFGQGRWADPPPTSGRQPEHCPRLHPKVAYAF